MCLLEANKQNNTCMSQQEWAPNATLIAEEGRQGAWCAAAGTYARAALVAATMESCSFKKNDGDLESWLVHSTTLVHGQH